MFVKKLLAACMALTKSIAGLCFSLLGTYCLLSKLFDSFETVTTPMWKQHEAGRKSEEVEITKFLFTLK